MPSIDDDNIYYIDLGPDPDFTDGSFISIYPENLTFDEEIRAVGNIAFQISFSAKDQDGNIVVSGHDVIGPYRTYYRLRYGYRAIMAGVITSWSTTLGADFMSVTGKTWEHFFERWMYPFDPRPSHVNDYVLYDTYQNDELIGTGAITPQGLAYQAYQRDVILILSDIISQTMNAVPHRLIFDLSNLTTLSGIKTNYQLSLGDTSYMDSFVNGLAGTGIGFDWWISWTRKLYWASPFRFGNPGSPSYVHSFTDTDLPEGTEFTNNGPIATHILGTGAGLAAQTTLGRAYGYVPAQEQFTRLDAAVDFGDVRNVNQLIEKTQRELSFDLQPQHEIPLILNPDEFLFYWSNFRKGRAIHIDVELVAHRINSYQQLKRYEASMDQEGNVEVNWTLQQIYDLSYNAGSAEA